METSHITTLFAENLIQVASEYGVSCAHEAYYAWSSVGIAYLRFVLCGISSHELRKIQYDVLQEYGAIVLNCKWYDLLKKKFFNGHDTLQTILLDSKGSLKEVVITENLFLEMLDFCREGY